MVRLITSRWTSEIPIKAIAPAPPGALRVAVPDRVS
jgi:hypothetical protein